MAGLRLRFDAPGARAAGMGGASEALTDFFTAASNPASLARQKQRVAAIEARHTSAETPYAVSGTVGSLGFSSFETSANEIGGAILVLPGGRATWAVYYDEPLRLSADTTRIQPSPELIVVGMRGDEILPTSECEVPENTPPTCYFAAFSTPAVMRGITDLRLRRLGAAVATELGRLSLGGGVQYAHLEESYSGFAPMQWADQGRVTWNAGAQLALTSRIRLGASYQAGARYDTMRRFFVVGPNNEAIETVLASRVGTPSSYGAGVAAEVTPNLTFAVDARRVNYSEMLQPNAGNILDSPTQGFLYETPDVTELRAGAEYRLATRVPVALRAGWWHEPAHRARLAGDHVVTKALNEILALDSDERHITAGVGVGDRVRVDAAVDRSERTTRASVAVGTTF